MSDIDDIVRQHVHGTLNPADNIGAFISENAAIVRELATLQAYELAGNMSQCLFCSGDGEPANHELSCLWRRAKTLYPS